MDAAVAGISLSKAALQSQLSKCARFQAFASNTAVPLDEAGALARIATDAWPFPLDDRGNIKEAYSPDELRAIRPFAMIFSEPRRGYRLQGVGAMTASVEAGTLQIHFEKDIPASLLKTPGDVNRQWDNDLGQIARELMDLKGLAAGGMLLIDTIDVFGPFFSDESQAAGQGDFCYALMTVSWGQGGGS